MVTDLDKFEETLDNAPSRWEKAMVVKKKKGDHPRQRPEHTHGGESEPTATVLSYPSNNQTSNPDSLHVTQKVVLFNQTELDALKELIEYHDTSPK